MSIAMPWMILMVTEAYRYGIHPADGKPRWPEPSRFVLGSVAMGFAAVVAQFDGRVGGLLAWGLLLGAIVQQAGPNRKTTASNSAPKQSIVTATSTTQQPTFTV